MKPQTTRAGMTRAGMGQNVPCPAGRERADRQAEELKLPTASVFISIAFATNSGNNWSDPVQYVPDHPQLPRWLRRPYHLWGSLSAACDLPCFVPRHR